MMKPPHRFGVLFLFLCLASHATSLTFSCPFSSSPPPPRMDRQLSKGFIEEESKVSFSIDNPDDAKAMKLLEKAKRKLAMPNTCWHRAYTQLFSSCSKIASSNEKQERLAWMLSDCFQLDSGRRDFPSCDNAELMMRCLKKLDDAEHKVFLEFYLESILTAQEEFEAKKANIFAALEKLFLLNDVLLTESRFIKAFFFYSCVTFFLYMLTSAKQTFGVRARLYLGLCITFVAEIAIIIYSSINSNQQNWVISKVWMVRSSFVVAASTLILHSIFTYRDYKVINYQLLQLLLENVRVREQNSGREYLGLGDESEMSGSEYSWTEEELTEDVDMADDPNYALSEEVAENSIMTTTSACRRYNFRPHSRF